MDEDAQASFAVGCRRTRARVADLRFVADELTSRRRADPDRIGVLGHSMGGAAAAEAVRQDERFAAGLHLDGGLFGSPVPEVGLDRPFLMLTSFADHETWQHWREHQHGWGRQLRQLDSGHLSFTDWPHVAGPGHFAQNTSTELYQQLFGGIAAERTTGISRAYVRAFFDHFLGDRPAPLLDAASARFPEVTFVWSRD
ncbi:prolyl oligopeptidase family serine peptidase [Kitasatospora sp. NPDC051170]|uniref:prolyl oligopeptidase family serine peptidase n=1 Tax=Kitasatospora sp. NPDC051170 TaxID=3364056 RepID=UPI0037B2CED0